MFSTLAQIHIPKPEARSSPPLLPATTTLVLSENHGSSGSKDTLEQNQNGYSTAARAAKTKTERGYRRHLIGTGTLAHESKKPVR